MGFTLAELLSALAILGIIATFTIPKVLNGSQRGQNLAMTKEVISSMSGAHQAVGLSTGLSSTTTLADFTQFLNYVSVDSSSTIDSSCAPTSALACSPVSVTCLKLHNGGVLRFNNNITYNGSGNLNALFYQFDPDGAVNGEESVTGWIYFNGKVRSTRDIDANTVNSQTTYNPNTSCLPDWFEW